MKNNRLFFLITLIGLCTLTHTSFAMEYVGDEALGQAIIDENEKSIAEAIETYNIDINKSIRYADSCLPPLEMAIFRNKPKAVKLLIQQGASAKRRTFYGATLIDLAIRRKACPDVIKFLLENGADACSYDERGHNALHTYCIFSGEKNPEIIELLAQKPGIDCPTLYGEETPLHIAAEKSLHCDTIYSFIQTLLNLGANPCCLGDKENNRPLDTIISAMTPLVNSNENRAWQQHIIKTAQLLLIHGAQANNYDINHYLTSEELTFVEQEKKRLKTLKRTRNEGLHQILQDTIPSLPATLFPTISDYDNTVHYELPPEKAAGRWRCVIQ